jgi:xanthosine utilization system XapX-like protein
VVALLQPLLALRYPDPVMVAVVGSLGIAVVVGVAGLSCVGEQVYV